MQKIILYPTDTVYGLGVDATDPAALAVLYDLKGREEGKYFPIVVADIAMARRYAVFTPLAELLSERFWPGKLTLVLKAQNLPQELLAPDGTVGVRIPDYPAAIELVRALGRPLTATSANVSGMQAAGTPPEILAQFAGKAKDITRVVDAGALPPSAPSSVVDAQGTEPKILRAGAISEVAILDALR